MANLISLKVLPVLIKCVVGAAVNEGNGTTDVGQRHSAMHCHLKTLKRHDFRSKCPNDETSKRFSNNEISKRDDFQLRRQIFETSKRQMSNVETLEHQNVETIFNQTRRYMASRRISKTLDKCPERQRMENILNNNPNSKLYNSLKEQFRDLNDKNLLLFNFNECKIIKSDSIFNLKWMKMISLTNASEKISKVFNEIQNYSFN